MLYLNEEVDDSRRKQSQCSEEIYACVRFSLARNFVVVLCQQLEEERKRNEEDGESSSDDHIFVVDDTVHDCLLKLDIFHSRHVLGKRGRITERKRDDTQKRERMRRREDCEKRSEIMEEAYYYRERERKRRKGLFLLMNIMYTEDGGHEFQKTTFRMFTFRFSL
jgi:hypothetical protein